MWACVLALSFSSIKWFVCSPHFNLPAAACQICTALDHHRLAQCVVKCFDRRRFFPLLSVKCLIVYPENVNQKGQSSWCQVQREASNGGHQLWRFTVHLSPESQLISFTCPPHLGFILNWMPSPHLSSKPQLPQTESWMFTGRITPLSAARVFNARLSKLQIKDVQDEQMFANRESPKVLCRQHCDMSWIRMEIECLSLKAQSYLLLFGSV